MTASQTATPALESASLSLQLPGRSVRLLLSALFFVSGFAAILYQLVWQRKLYALVGINVEVVTLIVTLFIAGLGLGSLAGGVASRLGGRRLISAFAAVELGIGLFGAASPWLFSALGQVAPSLGPLGVAAGVSLLVLPPTMAMGATLPILVTYLVRRRASVGVAVGTLYCVNTLGSAIAAFMVALFLMRWVGQSGVLAIAVLGNLTAGGSALVLRWRLS
jgi:spermidine synthase